MKGEEFFCTQCVKVHSVNVHMYKGQGTGSLLVAAMSSLTVTGFGQ